MRRLARCAVGLAVGGCVVLPAAPASAHVVLDRSEVAAGSSADLEFRAPIERQGVTNRKIYALVPGPIAVASCAGPSAAWRCTLDTTTRAGDTFVTWETPVAGSPQDLRFRFRVTVPRDTATGERKLPVVQTYSDGEVSRWIDDGEPSPAPRLTVIGVGQSPAPPSPAPVATAHSEPGSTGAPAAPRTSSTRAATTAPSAAPPSTAASPTAVPSSLGEATASASATPALGEAGEETTTGGSGPLVAALGVLVGLSLAVGAVVVVRRRA